MDERFPIGFVCQGETPPVNSFEAGDDRTHGGVAQLGKNRGIDSATSVCTHVLMREDESETTPKERVMGGVAGAEENGERRKEATKMKGRSVHCTEATLHLASSSK